VFFLFGFKTGGGEPNWPVTAYISGLVLGVIWLAGELQSAAGGYRRVTRAGLAVACLAGVALSLAVHCSTWIHPLLLRFTEPPSAERPFPLRRFDPTLRLRGWRTLTAEVDRLRQQLRETEGEPILAASGWSLPGLIGFYCEGHPTVYSLGPAFGDRCSQYDFWRPNPIHDSGEFRGRTFLIVAGSALDLADVFEEVETYHVVHTENGQPTAGWVILVCRNFRGFGPRLKPAHQRHF